MKLCFQMVKGDVVQISFKIFRYLVVYVERIAAYSMYSSKVS